MHVQNRAYKILFSVITAFLLTAGAVYAATVFATLTGDGAYKQWTPTPAGALTHAALVNESGGCNGSYDFVSSTEHYGTMDTYEVDLSGVPNGTSIDKVEIGACGASSAALGDKSTLGVLYIYNGVTSTVAWNLVNDTTDFYQIATSTWIANHYKDASSKMQIGIFHNDANLNGLKVSQLKTFLDY